jgi:hypothetical protein
MVGIRLILGEEAVRPFACLVVHVPIERGRQQQALRCFEAKRVDIGDEHQQSRHLLAALEYAEFPAKLDCIDVVRWPTGEPDDLGLGRLRLKNEGRQVRR